MLNLPRIDVYAQALGLYTSGDAGIKRANLAWRLLQEVDPYVSTFASSITFNDHDMLSMMRQSRALTDSNTENVPFQTACSWVKKNEAVWGGWILPVCPNGSYFDMHTRGCSECPAGYYCEGGSFDRVLCPANFFCPRNQSVPTPCPSNWATVSTGSINKAGCSICASGNSTQFVVPVCCLQSVLPLKRSPLAFSCELVRSLTRMSLRLACL